MKSSNAGGEIRPQLVAVLGGDVVPGLDLVESLPVEARRPGDEDPVVRGTRDGMARPQDDAAYGANAAVVEGIGLLDAADRRHGDDLVAETVRALTLVQAADANEAVGRGEKGVAHHALADGAADEGLDRPHHPDVSGVVDRVVAHRAGEHGQVLGDQVRRTDDRLVLVDVGDDVVDLLGHVAEPGQRPRDRLVDDRHRPATDELLGLHQTEIGLDAGGVAVEHERDGAGRGQHTGLGVAHAVLLAELDGVVPGLLGGREQLHAARAPRRSWPPRPGASAAR